MINLEDVVCGAYKLHCIREVTTWLNDQTVQLKSPQLWRNLAHSIFTQKRILKCERRAQRKKCLLYNSTTATVSGLVMTERVCTASWHSFQMVKNEQGWHINQNYFWGEETLVLKSFVLEMLQHEGRAVTVSASQSIREEQLARSWDNTCSISLKFLSYWAAGWDDSLGRYKASCWRHLSSRWCTQFERSTLVLVILQF